jgi:hypothetical protein
MLRAALLFLLVAVVLSAGVAGCCVFTCRPLPAAPCEIETLLVQETVLPEGWEESGPPRSADAAARFGIEKIGTGFSTPRHGVAIQAVYRARNTGAAASGYQDFMSYFSLREEETEWFLPSELTYDTTADRFRLGCSAERTSGVERCQLIAQYGVYLLRFHIYMSPEMMTYDDLEHILQDIERRMAECFK